jgi:hypothetical protein
LEKGEKEKEKEREKNKVEVAEEIPIHDFCGQCT